MLTIQTEKMLNPFYTAVIDIPALSSVTAESPIAVIRISGGVVTDQTSVLMDLLVSLSENKIQLNDLITSATSIGVFVNWNQRKEALTVVQKLFESN